MCVLNVVVVVSKGKLICRGTTGTPALKHRTPNSWVLGGKTKKDPCEGEREPRLISSPRSESTGGRREEREG